MHLALADISIVSVFAGRITSALVSIWALE
jgi:hypothetical protein